ncbi:P-loop containing nucleoside triphosphate hydrolase protein, partial [Dendrothele bispora CBS 962.96]
YQEGKFHFAIAGLSGSGKSSLVNAFRGVLNETANAAAIGITETTTVVGRYPDPNPDKPCVWYDIPGAGTLTIKDWDYFNKQGLYIFDAIIVLFDNRFTATDIAILRNCERWKIPAFIVRSKSDQQIENLKKSSADRIEEDESLDEDERASRLETVLDVAIEKYKSQTRQNVKSNLKDDGLADQDVYLVSYKALLNVIRGKSTRGVLYLDEANLLAKVVEASKERRCPPAWSPRAEVSRSGVLEKAKNDLLNGIQPVVQPTEEEYTRTLKAYQYQEGKFHLAITGLSGSGKSSLINAFRGVLNETANAAAIDTTETTTVVGRYPDPNPDKPCVWYDIPGAGTLTIKDWDYFNKQGLYIFDAIIILFDNRFTATDIAILRNCGRWKIPTFIVRSKSDQQIENLKKSLADRIEEDESLDEDEQASQLETVLDVAIEEYKLQTRQSVKKNLKDAGLEDQDVYLVSYKALLNVVR